MPANASPAVLAPVDGLPALPHYDDVSCGGEPTYTADTLREYARAAVEQMAADLAAAEEEGEKARAALLDARHGCEMLTAQNEALRQRAEAAEADAARYRLIRSKSHGGVIFCGPLPGGSLNCDEPESEWDAAIDAAIALQEPRQ